jgi:hypothetical protein
MKHPYLDFDTQWNDYMDVPCDHRKTINIHT